MSSPFKYTAQDVLDFIENENPLRNPKYYNNNHTDIYNAAFRRKELGSWKKAVDKTRKDYQTSCKRGQKWKEAELERIITKRIILGRNLHKHHMYYYYSTLLTTSKNKYGSYEALLEKCGQKYNRIKRGRNWTRKKIISDIIFLEQKGYDISPSGLREIDPALLYVAYDKFSNHKEFPLISNYDYALMNCGINPESIRKKRKWNKYLILYEMREHVKQGHSTNWLKQHDEGNLASTIENKKKGTRKIIEAVKLFEEYGLFDRLEEFKQIKRYKEKIKTLRNISMENRQLKKRDIIYIIN